MNSITLQTAAVSLYEQLGTKNYELYNTFVFVKHFMQTRYFLKNWQNFILKNGDIKINSSQIMTLLLVDSDHVECNLIGLLKGNSTLKTKWPKIKVHI